MRTEVFNALKSIEGLIVRVEWPKVMGEESPLAVFSQTSGGDRSDDIEGNLLDEYVQYTIHLFGTSYHEIEEYPGKIKQAMRGLGFKTAMEYSPEQDRITMIFDIVWDVTSGIAHRRR